jgi:hypothetical protein
VKKGDAAELSAKWWKTSQPKGLASAGKLELALKAHEMAVSAFEKQPEAVRHKTAADSLDVVKDAVDRVIAEAAKAKKNEEMDWTVAALKKIDFAKEAKALDGKLKKDGKDEDDEEDDSSALADPVAYAKVLRKGLNKVKDEPWNWGFLVGKKPIEHRLLLHRSKQGRALAMMAAKELGRAPKLSFGTTIRDPNDNGTLILTVQGAMLAGLATRCKKMLLKMKPQTVSEVVLMVDGQIVPEAFDPDDLDMDEGASVQVENPQLEALHNRISALEPRLAAVMATQPGFKDRLQAAVTRLMDSMAKEDVAAAGSTLGKLEEAVTRLEQVAGIAPGAARAAAGTLSVWQTAKDAADDQLRALSDHLRTIGIPVLNDVSDEVESLLEPLGVKLVAALLNYDRAPASPQARAGALSAIAAASDWLHSDERVEAVDNNPFEVAVSAGATLDAALRELQRELATKAGGQA